MAKRFCIPLTAAIAMVMPGAAFAQGAAEAEPFVGVSAGYHEFDVDDDVDFDGVDTGSPIIGVVAGVDVPLSERLFAGIEGNLHFGTDIVDTEYGASARLGFMIQDGSKFYVRGGYQEVDFDLGEIVNVDLDDLDDLDGFDTTEGDYLLGIGGDLPVGAGALRLNLDTIGFDTVRGTAGYVLTF